VVIVVMEEIRVMYRPINRHENMDKWYKITAYGVEDLGESRTASRNVNRNRWCCLER